MGQREVTGDNMMVVIFAERLSPVVRRLYSQNMTAEDAANFVERGIIKRSGTAAPISAQRRAQFGDFRNWSAADLHGNARWGRLDPWLTLERS